MLFSRAGTYPDGFEGRLDSDAFSPNTHAGACPDCHGIGIVHSVSESSLVPNPNLSIAEKAIAAWPGAWQGKNYRDILAVLGYDINKPWKDLSQKDRDWILFTEEKPVVTVYAEREAHRIQRPYQGTYMSAAVYVKHTFGTTGSAALRRRAESFMDKAPCTSCQGKRLRSESLAVRFAGFDIAELYHMPLSRLKEILAGAAELKASSKSVSQSSSKSASKSTSKSASQPAPQSSSSSSSGSASQLAPQSSSRADVARLIVDDLVERIELLSRLGLDYLSMDRATPTLSVGELQRLRLATQLKSGLFGVVYVLDEPSAGLHPADSEALLETLGMLKDSGNSLFVVEHEMDIVRAADWIVDIGPGAGEGGGHLLYSGPIAGLAKAKESLTKKYLFAESSQSRQRETRTPSDWMTLSGVTMHNLQNLEARFPLAVFTAVTGVSGSGKSTLVSQVLADSVREKLGIQKDVVEQAEEDETSTSAVMKDAGEDDIAVQDESVCRVQLDGSEALSRLVVVDQKPIGRTPRSNLATYTGLFDFVRKAFAATAEAKSRGFNAGRFSFNVAGGRCTTCEGEGFVSVELMFLPSVYAPCSSCQGKRYNEETLTVTYRGLNIAQVLDMTVDSAGEFFTEIPAVARALSILSQVGLGYLRLGQPATELSGGEAQRIRLATELQREQRGDTLYILDEPTTGLHPADVEKLMSQLHSLVDAGNTVIVVEHDMDVIAGADWIIDMGPGAGSQGGRVVASGTPAKVAKAKGSRTAPYLLKRLNTLN